MTIFALCYKSYLMRCTRTHYTFNIQVEINNQQKEYRKRYFIIDQQIEGHFVHYSECLFHPPLPSYATQINNPLLTSMISANPDKELGFFCQS